MAKEAPTKINRDRLDLYREINALSRRCTKSDGRVVFGWRAQRLMELLRGYYESCLREAEMRPASEIRMRLLLLTLLRRRRVQLVTRAALGIGAANVCYGMGIIAYWPVAVLALLALLAIASNLETTRYHALALDAVRQPRRPRLVAVK